MARHVLIVHGWSDTSRSFYPLTKFLEENGYNPTVLWLGDYISKDDDVRVEDVARRMGEVIDEMQHTGVLESSFDMIVHSTGGLVARAWLTTRYQSRAEACPMKRLVMLAPANYGSKLAAMGKSVLGRLVKGYDNWFQTGQSMLNDLELSSPYQWDLVQRDVLIPPGGNSMKYYASDRVWPFVITGSHPYAGFLKQAVNEDGSDGTVRVCAANLNARGVTIDFSRPMQDPLFFQAWESRLECDVPIAVLPTRTHGSIVDPERLSKSNQEDISETNIEKLLLGKLILQALGCKDFKEYTAIEAEWTTGITEATAARSTHPPKGSKSDYFHQYFQMNAYVVDDHGQPVPDYMLEFFSSTAKRSEEANAYLLASVLEDVKKNSQKDALRNLYFDRTDLMENYYTMLKKSVEATLFMSISAASPGKNIKYFERDKDGATQNVPVHLEEDSPDQRWLKRNTTHFVQIIIPRIPSGNVFRLTSANQLDLG